MEESKCVIIFSFNIFIFCLGYLNAIEFKRSQNLPAQIFS